MRGTRHCGQERSTARCLVGLYSLLEDVALTLEALALSLPTLQRVLTQPQENFEKS
jgi:hypothetical protein